MLQDFPEPGRTATIEWVEGVQNFVIVGKGGGGTPTQCPSNGPITNLLLDCSDFLYLYVAGSVVAGVSSDGEVAVICTVAAGDPDVLCFGGPVSSATTFTLVGANLNGGPLVPLGAGSAGNIGNGGRSLSFTVVLDGEVFPFTGFAYAETEPLSTIATTSSEDLRASVDLLRAAIEQTAATDASTESSASDDAALRARVATLIGQMPR